MTIPNNTRGRWGEFLQGCLDEAPILLGTMPFGLIYGVLALNAGLPAGVAQAMSAIVFAGSAQFIAAQLIGEATAGIVVVATIFVVNLRHALYSASLAPYVRHLNGGWKALLAYLLTDEAYAVAIVRYQRDAEAGVKPPFQHWHTFGAAFLLWSSWQLSTAIGVFLGASVPANWGLDFTLALTFIALVFTSVRARPMWVAAVTAGVIAVLAHGLPYNFGLMLAAAGGILAGLVAEAQTGVAPRRPFPNP
jgi:4-azaleucine resistance transporter AzlC